MWTDDYVGLPFKARGRDRRGLDCWGLFRLLYRERLGIELPSWDIYQTTTDGIIGQTIAEQARAWQPVATAREGDGILFTGKAWHIGFCLNDTDMLHICRSRESCIESFRSPIWAGRIEGIYRWAT